jgi:hypothetical protein
VGDCVQAQPLGGIAELFSGTQAIHCPFFDRDFVPSALSLANFSTANVGIFAFFL